MAGSKKYFHDRIILLLSSINAFLLILLVLFILLRLGSGGGNYIDQYRSSLGIGAFRVGSLASFLLFMLFGALVLVFHSVLSFKVYGIRRQFAITILGLGSLLLLLSIIVSNALLVLR